MSAAARTASLVLAAFLTLLLGACIPQVPELPEDRFYRLGEAQVPLDLPQLTVEGDVAVARVVSDGLHSERSILFAEADEPLRIMRHHYDLWADNPPALIQDHLVSFLRAAKVGERVVRAETGFRHGLVLEPRLLRFERLLDEGASAVVVALEFTARRDGAAHLLSYQERRTAADDGMYAAVEAFGAALNAIYVRLVRDLATP